VFDIGFWEMSVIGLIALIVLGPERLPKVARTAGLWIGRARRMVSDVKADINREIRMSELKELEDAKKSVEDVGSQFKSSLDDISEGVRKEADELNIKDAIQETAGDITGASETAASNDSNGKKQ